MAEMLGKTLNPAKQMTLMCFLPHNAFVEACGTGHATLTCLHMSSTLCGDAIRFRVQGL